MMAPEPLKSAITSPALEDTSLALPSDNKLRSGQQRVLDQVHTIRRSKSKQGKNGTLSPSPTSLSPQALTTYEFGTFKFDPAKSNGNLSRVSSAISAGYSKTFNTQKNRTMSNRTMGGRHTSTSSTWEQHFNTSTWPSGNNNLKPSRSDPSLAPAFSVAPPPAPAPAPPPAPAPVAASGIVMRAKGQTVQTQQTRTNRQSTYSMTNSVPMTSSQTRFMRPPSAQSQTDGKMGTIKITKSEQQSVMSSGVSMPDMTLKDAVTYLSHPEDNYQQCGATFIQHTTFKEERTKQEVLDLGGIPPLVTLLRSSSPGVSQAAAGALRNLVFKHPSNKQEVQQCGGIGKALQLLKETDTTETQKQITGLLWNLSSADELKEELIATALPALTENVVVPFTCWSDNSANNNIHPDVFYSATGCLRNLSCGQKKERQAMRDCRGLIDSLMSYVQSCVAEENPDDKSVENCVCILHNLTYQLENECPECFSKFYPNTEVDPGVKKNTTIGCFSPKSSKVQKECLFDMSRIPEDSSPAGVKWLCHPSAMQTYLSLLGSSQKDATLEASCGALQNLTANTGRGASAMSQIMSQKLGALAHLAPLLKSPNHSLQKTALSLLGNMSRSSNLQAPMAKQMLPELTSLLSSSTRDMGNSDDTIASACGTVRSLLMADSEISKKVVTKELVSSLADISENGSFPKASRAASMLLYSLWNEKNLQGLVKKLGYEKSFFVNDITSAVHKSMQVIE